jgi:hypothetical protein
MLSDLLAQSTLSNWEVFLEAERERKIEGGSASLLVIAGMRETKDKSHQADGIQESDYS